MMQCFLPMHQKLHCTYYMAQVDPRVTLVTISAARGKDRDTKSTALLTGTLDVIFSCSHRRTHVWCTQATPPHTSPLSIAR